MGQKIHPVGLRLGIIRGWESRWFQSKNFAELLGEDYKIRKYIQDHFRHASVARIEIERAQKVHVIVNTGKPGCRSKHPVADSRARHNFRQREASQAQLHRHALDPAAPHDENGRPFAASLQKGIVGHDHRRVTPSSLDGDRDRHVLAQESRHRIDLEPDVHGAALCIDAWRDEVDGRRE